MNKLIALADRVEKLTGPDREVDAEIADAIGWWLSERERLGPNAPMVMEAARFTASIDAAMTLVPRGWGWMVSQPNEKAIASGLLKERTPVMGEVEYGCDHRYAVACATPALALTCAALRAIEDAGYRVVKA